MVADERSAGEQISAEVQWRLNTLISSSEYSANRLVFGSNPADLFGRGDKDDDLLFT